MNGIEDHAAEMRRLRLEIARLQADNVRLTIQNRELRELVAEYENREVEA